MPVAGVAFDGSIWVTAGSSLALVFGAAAFTASGAYFLAKAAERGSLGASFTESANTRLQRSRPVLKINRSQLQNGQPRIQEPDSISADDTMQNGKQ